jgi:hypothetical protein
MTIMLRFSEILKSNSLQETKLFWVRGFVFFLCLSRPTSLWEPRLGHDRFLPSLQLHFRRVRKTAFSDDWLRHVRLSVCLSARNDLAPTESIFVKFDIWVCFVNLPRIRGVFKNRPNFLNSAPTSTESALRLLSAPSVRFWQQTAICPVSLCALVVELHPLNWACAQAVLRISDNEKSLKNNVCVCVKLYSSLFKIGQE